MQVHAAPIETAINTDVRCVTCGYVLRGLAADAICPECATDVQQSLHGDDLRYADPAWLRSLARGLTLLRWSFVLCIANVIGFLALMIVLMLVSVAVKSARQSANALIGVVAVGTGVVGITLMVCGALGVWFITRLEPRDALQDRVPIARSVARYALLTALASVPLGGAAELVAAAIGSVRYVGTVTLFVFFAAGSVAAVACLSVIEQVLRRTDLHEQQRKLKRVRIKALFAAALVVVGSTAPGISNMVAAAPAAIQAIVSFVPLVALFWMVALMSQVYPVLGNLRDDIRSFMTGPSRRHAPPSPDHLEIRKLETRRDDATQ